MSEILEEMIVETAKSDVNSGKCAGVYDKKLLDRAMLYCNNDAGIANWTRYTDGATITDAVAYSWGCADSIADFNADLEEQRVALSAYYSDGTNENPYPINNEILGDNPDPADHRDWSPWEQFIAPGVEANDRWHNYLKGIYDETTETYDYLTINGNRYNPYLPGLSSYKQNVLKNYHDYDSKRSAGTDCSGYIQKCAGYDSNPYTSIPDIKDRVIWGGGSETLIGPQGFASDEYTWPVENRNLLVPGDIISCAGHVALIFKIEYEDNFRTVSPGNVYIIEAAGAGMIVRKDRNWQDFIISDDFTNVTPRRIKTN